MPPAWPQGEDVPGCGVPPGGKMNARRRAGGPSTRRPPSRVTTPQGGRAGGAPPACAGYGRRPRSDAARLPTYTLGCGRAPAPGALAVQPSRRRPGGYLLCSLKVFHLPSGALPGPPGVERTAQAHSGPASAPAPPSPGPRPRPARRGSRPRDLRGGGRLSGLVPPPGSGRWSPREPAGGALQLPGLQ